MLTRTGLSKSMMIDRPEQVLAFIRNTSDSGCAVVATYDAALAFTLSHPLPLQMVLVSPFSPPIAVSGQPIPESCSRATLYVVHSYLGGESEFADRINRQLDSAAQLIEGPAETAQLSRDPDAAGRRALAKLPLIGRQSAAAARLPEYRYTVVAGPIDAAGIRMLSSRLPDFCTYPCAARRP